MHGSTKLIRRCDDLPATITHVPVAAVLVLNTPDDGRLRPKHVEWPCRNKTCTVLHQVGVSFDLSISSLYSFSYFLTSFVFAHSTPCLQKRIKLWMLQYNFSKEEHSSLMMIRNRSKHVRVILIVFLIVFMWNLCKWNCWLIIEVILRNARCNNKVWGHYSNWSQRNSMGDDGMDLFCL